MRVTSGNFSRWLQIQKDKTGMTASDIARASGLTNASINGFLRGKQFPTLASMEMLAQAFGMRIEIRKN